jgi:hypothetical protein
LFHVAFIHPWCCGSTARSIICLFPAILNGIHPPANSFIWRSMSP